MTNRISKYDTGEWLALLVEQRLIEYGEQVVRAHESMSELWEGEDECY